MLITVIKRLIEKKLLVEKSAAKKGIQSAPSEYKYMNFGTEKF